MDDLHREARRLCRHFPPDPERVTESLELAADMLVRATGELRAKIGSSVDAHVRAAATVGSTRVDIFRFHGNDIDEASGLPYLSLLKGTRDPDLKVVLAERGYANLVDGLRADLAPFKVVHAWHRPSNLNRIFLSWDD